MNTAIIAMNGLDAHRALVIINRTQNAFAAGMLTASIRSLKAEMAKRIVRVTFLKKDGTITTRFATTLPSMTRSHVNGRGLPADYRNVVVFGTARQREKTSGVLSVLRSFFLTSKIPTGGGNPSPFPLSCGQITGVFKQIPNSI